MLDKKEKIVETLGLIDSGVGGKFINQNFAKEEKLEVKDLEKPLMVYNIDRTLNKTGTIKKYVDLPITINGMLDPMKKNQGSHQGTMNGREVPTKHKAVHQGCIISQIY